MIKSLSLGVLAAAFMALGASAGTLDRVKASGTVKCGVDPTLVGFAATDTNGVWRGFDVDFCRAVAAAALGDPAAVSYVEVSAKTRFEALLSGEIDLLARKTTWTFVNDVSRELDFAGISYYDGQGFMVRKSAGVTSAKELEGRKICVQTGSTSELNMADFFRVNNITYQPVLVESAADAHQKYVAGDCDVYSTDASGLAATRATFVDPDAHILLPEVISKEPLGPVVRHGDEQWADLVRWTLNALITAEELGVNSANVEELAANSDNPEVRRLLGAEGAMGETLGLTPDWAKMAIMAGGNYGEIFERNIGEATPIRLSRGLNALWTHGGLIYSPPFR
ncbi:amino acid ABC transporter substrate-binding protein [Actibacterium sp. XHP0104]|uniref:amino acid ABC transporter substrate-binding protein n=1 Tax=Actibacterium sp. XHP0104 TaxID=2984335 RepID=UPI0021E7C2BB|nr:amino acid ABC transporter substrate-binding protein [Actibacterium sp. XHP0104]MCV2882389.1 amino acid ABC transporter substrate-binding protein [Actibacterium sp. XHP0104]